MTPKNLPLSVALTAGAWAYVHRPVSPAKVDTPPVPPEGVEINCQAVPSHSSICPVAVPGGRWVASEGGDTIQAARSPDSNLISGGRDQVGGGNHIVQIVNVQSGLNDLGADVFEHPIVC